MTVILPKNHVTHWCGVPLFFFAGPVRGGGDWQYRAYQEFERILGYEGFCAAIPMRYEYDHLIHEQELPPNLKARQFIRQLEWERHYLRLSGTRQKKHRGCLLFWLAFESEENPHPGPEPYAMDTRREIGEWMTRLEILKDQVRMVVGADPRFYGLSQIQRALSEAIGEEFPIYGSIEETVTAAIAEANR